MADVQDDDQWLYGEDSSQVGKETSDVTNPPSKSVSLV